MSSKHVMLDLETLGTTADAVILSVGAVRFDPDSDAIDDRGFYASVSIDSNLEAGRRISEDTLLWWMRQSEDAQKVFFESKMVLEDALVDFCNWFGDAEFIWSNGADFDIPMVANALHSFCMQPPWKFYNSRCVRTYKNLPGCRDIKVVNEAKHNALSDALAQAKLVQAIQRRLKANHPMVKP